MKALAFLLDVLFTTMLFMLAIGLALLAVMKPSFWNISACVAMFYLAIFNLFKK